jgi:hypothetical protein
MRSGSRRGREGPKAQVIRLRLARASEMFELPQTDLFSEYRNFLTGVDFCLSEMRGRWSFRPVRLEIYLPPAEIDDGVAERISRTLRRYCDHRIRYNRHESNSQRFGGINALRIGGPLCAVGLALTVASISTLREGSIAEALAEQLGWVFVWIGLWFPLDQLLFYPLPYERETRVLRVLSQAGVVVSAHEPPTSLAAETGQGTGWRRGPPGIDGG